MAVMDPCLPYIIPFLDHVKWLAQTCGLKQWDPLSPFLFFFTLVVDPCQILKVEEDQNLIKGFRVGKELVPISYLHYATDTLFLWMERRTT